MEVKKEDNREIINEIINELNECREDERSTQNQIVQVIVTAGTILGLFFSVSHLKEIKEMSQIVVLCLSDLIFVIAFSYITALGISSVLRYHYIRGLEDILYVFDLKQHAEINFVHWMSFSSSITTRNPLHAIKSGHALIHYFYYTISVICAGLFSIFVTYVQYRNIKLNEVLSDFETKILNWAVIVPMVFIAISILVYVISCIRAQKIYNDTMTKSKEKLKTRISGITNKSNEIVMKKEQQITTNNKKSKKKQNKKLSKKEIWRVISYFVYPKKQDLQKTILMILSFFSGIFLFNGRITFSLIGDKLYELLISIIIIDVLIYQARYQWNDIRGLKEDMRARKTNRLPAHIIGEKTAILISLIIVGIRNVAALFIILLCGKTIKIPLFTCWIIIIVSSLIYEFVRSYKMNILIFLFVGWGYPIRLIAGVWTAWPGIWIEFPMNLNSIMQTTETLTPYIIMGIMIVAYFCFGVYSVALSWTQEVIWQVKNIKFVDKSHYKCLFEIVKKRYNKSIASNCKDNVFPLREKGELKDFWSWLYVISMILLSSVLLVVNFSIQKLVLEVLLILVIICFCFASHDKIKICFILTLGIIVAKAILAVFNLSYYTLYIFVCINQALFVVIYFYLRYLFEPDYEFIQFCKDILSRIFIFIVGKQTWKYITKEKQI